MVAYLASLAIFISLVCAPAWGGQPREKCLACHPVHYGERRTCTGCHRGNPASLRKNVAHHFLIPGRYAAFILGNVEVVRQGSRLIDELSCRRCHVTGGRGNRFATSLDLLLERKPTAEIADAIKSPAQGMPNFKLDEGGIVAIVNAIYAGTPKAGKQGRELPLTVHFEKTGRESEDIFSRRCGACHRMLSARRGLLGSGEVGPNLSGMLSEFYPASFEGNKRWTQQRLLRWVENPRRVSPNALMPPVSLDAREIRELKNALAREAE